MAYDARGQLTNYSSGSVNASYTYDLAGNLLNMSDSQGSRTMTYSADNKIETFQGNSVTYDADGNMTNGPIANTMINLIYDARNRLKSAGDSSYTYDAENKRVGMTQNGTTTRYVINPNAPLSQVLMETDASGTPASYFVYGLGLISQINTAGSYSIFHYDLRGSSVALTDITGNVTDQYAYTPYGGLESHSGNTITPFLYNGRDGVQTDANGLNYMRARYHDSSMGRFINQDVLLGNIDVPLTLNRYAYAQGNSTVYIDPLGREAFTTTMGAISFVTSVVAFSALFVAAAPLETLAGGAVMIGALASGISGFYTERVTYKEKPRDTEYVITQAVNLLGVIPGVGLVGKGLGRPILKFTESVWYGNLAIHAGFGATAYDGVKTYADSKKKLSKNK